jgi:hypothetical protein
MGPGTQLKAPEGMGSMQRDLTYYLVASRTQHGHVLLAWFEVAGHEQRVHFIRMASRDFENALVSGRVVCAREQSTLPPWLKGLEGVDVASLEESRRSKVKSYQERAESRLESIAELVDRHEKIVASEDPYLAIRRVLAEHHPKLKAARVAPWYVAYVLFGMSTNALLPAYCEIGNWIRSPDKYDKKLGRPAGHGRLYGHSAIGLRSKIVDSYLEYAGEGVSMIEIYCNAMEKTFGCLTKRDARNLHCYYHPDNLPFPSFGQFKYWVEKEFGASHVQRARLGETGYRNKVAVSAGPFSAAVSNILERVEQDGYYVKARPTALLSDKADLPVSICRMVCIATGGVAGVGAAYGAENTDAYRTMLFCAAVDKQWFASLLGLEIGPDDWPFRGLAIEHIGDRGPGESTRVAPTGESVVLPDRTMTPSWTPQSKGTVESSHPRTAVIQGAPSYVQSDLTALGVFRREVLQAIKDNDESDASSRHTPEMVAENVAANPHAIHKWLDLRGRSDAMSLSRNDAIRRFLKPVTFCLDASGLWLLSMRFDSAALASSGVRNQVRKGQTITLPGFYLPLCVRVCWLDMGDDLIEVKAQLSLRDGDEQLYLSYEELEGHDAKLRQIAAEHRAHAPAAASAARTAFREQTGSEWNAGKRKAGRRPPRALGRDSRLPQPPGRPRR